MSCNTGQTRCDIRWGRKLLFSKKSRLALGPTQSPIHCTSTCVFLQVKLPGIKMTTHRQVMMRVRKKGAIPQVPHTPSYCLFLLVNLFYISIRTTEIMLWKKKRIFCYVI